MENNEIPHGRTLSPEQMARLLDEFVNGHGEREWKEVAKEITTRVHRTLQQRIMGLFIATIESWAAKTPDQYDLRNEATVKLAKKIIDATGDKYDRHLPCI